MQIITPDYQTEKVCNEEKKKKNQEEEEEKNILPMAYWLSM
jgi:hypothetical protein